MDEIQKHLRDAVRRYGHHQVELEFRLGKQVGSKFISGVSEESFKKIQAALEKSQKLESLGTAVTTESTTESGYRFTEETQSWMHKMALAKVPLGQLEKDIHSPYVGRASIGLEMSILPQNAPHGEPMVHRRCKERTSFKYKCWRFDLTMVSHDERVYEVEVELWDTGALFMYTVEYLVIWGTALITDCARLAAAY